MSNYTEANSIALNLALSRRLAMVDGRNQQEAMIGCARKAREETKSKANYHMLGEFITAKPHDRQAMVELMELSFLQEINLN